MLRLFEKLGLDPEAETPGRDVVRHIGESLVQAMEMALASRQAGGGAARRRRVRRLAETKDHLNWELIGEAGGKLKGDEGKALKDAYEEVEEQEDEHLYHTTGWCRELWIESLGHARGAAAARGGEGSEDRHRGGAREEGPEGTAVVGAAGLSGRRAR